MDYSSIDVETLSRWAFVGDKAAVMELGLRAATGQLVSAKSAYQRGYDDGYSAGYDDGQKDA